MWRLIIFLIILIASVWFGIVTINHPGYLLLVFQPWMVQMPIWFALLCCIIFLLLFYLLISGIETIRLWWFKWKSWLSFRREHYAYSKTQQGVSALIEGNWKKAEHLFLVGVQQSLEPLINYLGAAKAAHKQGLYERRDNYIQKAYQVVPNASVAIGITRAELELDKDQLEQAVATLNHLRHLSPRHPRVIQLLEKAYVRLGDWKNLQSLLPNLYKTHLITSEQRQQFEKNLYCEILHATLNVDEVHKIWYAIPRQLKKNPEVVYAYVQQLIKTRPIPLVRENCHQVRPAGPDTPIIEELIRKTLKHHWQAELVKIYGTLPFENLNRQLVVVGGWYKIYGQHPELLLTLARLCVRVKLWGKAKDYFTKCLSLGPNVEAALEYGCLLEHLGETDAATDLFRKTLEQVATTQVDDNKISTRAMLASTDVKR